MLSSTVKQTQQQHTVNINTINNTINKAPQQEETNSLSAAGGFVASKYKRRRGRILYIQQREEGVELYSHSNCRTAEDDSKPSRGCDGGGLFFIPSATITDTLLGIDRENKRGRGGEADLLGWLAGCLLALTISTLLFLGLGSAYLLQTVKWSSGAHEETDATQKKEKKDLHIAKSDRPVFSHCLFVLYGRRDPKSESDVRGQNISYFLCPGE